MLSGGMKKALPAGLASCRHRDDPPSHLCPPCCLVWRTTREPNVAAWGGCGADSFLKLDIIDGEIKWKR